MIDQRVLNGDHGNYLIPVKPDTGYAEAALTEPWACHCGLPVAVPNDDPSEGNALDHWNGPG